MDYKAIEQIIKTAGESGLSFLEIETEGIRITLKKGEAENVVTKTETSSSEAAVANVDEKLAIKEEKVEVKEAIETKTQESGNFKVVTSPIVGTFYVSGSPEAEAFVQVGSKVKKGQTLGIIEAMKLMNEIESEFDGEVVEILVNNEQMVEYGQELFKIKV